MVKVRILQIADQLDIGGSEKTLQTYCKYLDKSQFEVIACGRERGGCRVKELEKLVVGQFQSSNPTISSKLHT